MIQVKLAIRLGHDTGSPFLCVVEMTDSDTNPTHRFPQQVDCVTLEWGKVSALLVRPSKPIAMIAFSHGAGAGIEHLFMADMAQRLAACGIATFRYHFPFMESQILSGQRKPPDRPRILVETVRAAVARAREVAADLPLIAAGKSMGGRMTSIAAAERPLDGVCGIVFFGFPLHPAGRVSSERAAHLSAVKVPMLFLQGTRDRLANLALLDPICASLGDFATLHISDGADHSFHVLKRSGRTNEEVAQELTMRTTSWIANIV